MTDPGRPVTDPEILLDSTFARLACDASVDELLEQAADGDAAELTEHQADCPHCRAALREFSRTWAPVAAEAARPIRLPAAVRAAVLGQVRWLTADIWHTVALAEDGALRIAAWVIARIARDAARQVSGVRVAFGRSTQGRTARRAEAATLGRRHPDAAVGVLGRTAVVDLAVAVQYGQRIEDIGREIQHRATAELYRQTGLTHVTVNVTVDDVIA